MSTLENIDITEALEKLDNGALLLDVRNQDEWEAGRATMATHIALSELPDHLDALDKGREIVCVCRSGGRSARAASFLLENGFNVVNLEGGMLGWAASDHELVSDGDEPTII